MGHFEELYPSRFLKGVTLLQPQTIRIVEVRGQVELEQDDGTKKEKVVLVYKDGGKHKEKPGEIVWNRTNSALAAAALSEVDPAKWGGRLITIHHDKSVAFGAEKKGGIRVLGSPEMTKSLSVAIKMPRRKNPIIYQLVPTQTKAAARPAPAAEEQPQTLVGRLARCRTLSEADAINEDALATYTGDDLEMWSKAYADKLRELASKVPQ